MYDFVVMVHSTCGRSRSSLCMKEHRTHYKHKIRISVSYTTEKVKTDLNISVRVFTDINFVYNFLYTKLISMFMFENSEKGNRLRHFIKLAPKGHIYNVQFRLKEHHTA